MNKLLLATMNEGKLAEMRHFFSGQGVSGIELVSLREMHLPSPEEKGDTFLANATEKAKAAAQASGLFAIGEDSGLVVDALGGLPGVYSARYAGSGATDDDNNRKLLRDLAHVPEDERTAAFHCVMVLASPEGEVHVAEGRCEGLILFEERGRHGFGYDPLFLFPPLGKTFAEMTREEKTRWSHRGQALHQLISLLDTAGILAYD